MMHYDNDYDPISDEYRKTILKCYFDNWYSGEICNNCIFYSDCEEKSKEDS